MPRYDGNTNKKTKKGRQARHLAYEEWETWARSALYSHPRHGEEKAGRTRR